LLRFLSCMNIIFCLLNNLSSEKIIIKNLVIYWINGM
jgi:hypothetical protein